MNKRLFSRLLTGAAAALFVSLFILTSEGSAQTPKFTRPTIVAVALEEAPFYHRKIFEDDDYLFTSRDYGNKGEYVPGFFVYGKTKNKWLEIKKLSVEHAKLGYSSPFPSEIRIDEKTGEKFFVVNPKNPKLPAGWDFRRFKNASYIDVPLRTTGSIMFPDKINYVENLKAYQLNFSSSYNIEEMLTQIWIKKADLERALK